MSLGEARVTGLGAARGSPVSPEHCLFVATGRSREVPKGGSHPNLAMKWAGGGNTIPPCPGAAWPACRSDAGAEDVVGADEVVEAADGGPSKIGICTNLTCFLNLLAI